MRAPVYRNLESKDVFLGLAFPFEVLVWLGFVLALLYVGVPIGTFLLGSAGSYALIRAAGLAGPPMYLRHRLIYFFLVRTGGGLLSAAARAAAPRFAHARMGHGFSPRAASAVLSLAQKRGAR